MSPRTVESLTDRHKRVECVTDNTCLSPRGVEHMFVISTRVIDFHKNGILLGEFFAIYLFV